MRQPPDSPTIVKALSTANAEGSLNQKQETIGARKIAHLSPDSIVKFNSSLTSLPRPNTCTRCREWVRRLAIYVTAQDGPAVDLCRKCLIEAAKHEANEPVRRQFCALFASLRPSTLRWRGALADCPAIGGAA